MENYNEETTNQPEQQSNLGQEPAQEDDNYGAEATSEGGSMFKIGSIIVILAIVVFGGLYLWGAVADKDSYGEENDMGLFDEDFGIGETQVVAPGSTVDEALKDVNDAVAEQLGTQGTSNDLGSIEADLNASDLGDVNLDNLGF